MTQNANFDLFRCFVCQSNEYVQISLHQNLLDASDFHNLEHKPNSYSYFLATCRKCGHSAIQTDNPCWMPTRKYSFIKYGEPIEHYPKVSLIIRALNLDFNDVSIHTFSYKDFQLANFLTNDLEISDINLNDHAGCSDDWLPVVSSDRSKRDPIPLNRFITEIENSEKSHQIILITSRNFSQSSSFFRSPVLLHLLLYLNHYLIKFLRFLFRREKSKLTFFHQLS